MNFPDNQKRWIIFGIALNKVLVTEIRPFVEQEIRKEYENLQASHNIHTQSYRGRLQKYAVTLRYENINGNDTLPRKPGGKYDYPTFDYRVTSYIDFAKLYVENHMAMFSAFDEHCDASAVLTLLGKVPVFPSVVQTAAGNVRKARNAWAHCVFSDWNLVGFQQSFTDMEQLVKSLRLPSADETALLRELNDCQNKGVVLCMTATVNPDLVKAVQQDLNALKKDVDKLAKFEKEEEREKLKAVLQDNAKALGELARRVSELEEDRCSLTAAVKITQRQMGELKSQQEDMITQVFQLGETLSPRVSLVEHEQEIFKEKVNTAQDKISKLQSDQEDMERRISYLGDQNSSNTQVSYEFASCEADITLFAGRHHPDTREWFFDDFNRWFENPGESRAYVLLGDAGVGKSVMAGALAQKSTKAGNLAAAYFCRHNDGTRNNPRYLLGTIACQLCKCNDDYNSAVGGEGGIRKFLANYDLGIQELFTKLLQEPSTKCRPFCQRKLIVIDALDETKYESRDDFLDLVVHRFPMLPQWLVFFITSRPEGTVQFRLEKYNPCIKICAGNSEDVRFYQQHELDIRVYLEKSVDFSHLPYSVDDLAKKCNGLFLLAYYIERVLKGHPYLGKIGELTNLFPGNIGDFFLQNFTRIFRKVGADLYKKLFGSAIAAPSPLPVSFISYILQREKSDLNEQEVIDAFSTFMVERTSDGTFAFLHSLIPSWLTDKKKASARLFVDRRKGGMYLRDIISEVLSAVIVSQQGECPPFIERDVFVYCVQIGVRLLCDYGDIDSLKIVFSCLTTYQFISRRLEKKRIEIYSIIDDMKFAVSCDGFGDKEKEILREICLFLEGNVHVLLRSPHLLGCCLREASKTVEENLVIPDNIGATAIECCWLPYSRCTLEIPSEPVCFAQSSVGVIARKLRKYLCIFDAFTLEIVQGPTAVTAERGGYRRIEFSPDGNFSFSRMLDEWFSVEEGCLKEFLPFATNDKQFWCPSSTFIDDDVGLQRRHPTRHMGEKNRKRGSFTSDRAWFMSCNTSGRCEIFKRSDGGFSFTSSNHTIPNVKLCAFLEDSNTLYYIKDCVPYCVPSLCAFHPETNSELLSVSGLSPFFHPLKKQDVYWFVEQNNETFNFLRDLPKNLRMFLLLLSGDDTTVISAAFVPTLFSMVGQTSGEDGIGPFVPVKSIVFSQNGDLVAIDRGPKLYVFTTFGAHSRAYLFCEDQGECDRLHLAFSPDSTLLLYCSQDSNNPRFRVWDVRSRVLLVTFDWPAESLLPSLHCCCLSSDNTKLIVCGGYLIEIWEYAAVGCRLIARIENRLLISSHSKFTYSTVSLENNLLACCITDRIALLPMNTPANQSVRLLPAAHLGKIEFCQFVKGGRYLISYGVDGNVFLWDLNAWRAIAFAKLFQGRESIVSLCGSFDGEKFFFLTSSGRLGVLHPCRLEHSILSTLPTLEVQSGEMMSEESSGQQGEQHGPTVPTHATDDLNVAEFIEEMEFMCDSEGSDDCDDVEVLG